METPAHPRDQFRAIAEINQQPIYFPNELGMQRLKWVWGALGVLLAWVVAATWTLSGKNRDLADAKTDIAQLKVDVATNKIVITTYDWKVWWDEHKTMWDQRLRGESNAAVFFREKGRAAPLQPEK